MKLETKIKQYNQALQTAVRLWSEISKVESHDLKRQYHDAIQTAVKLHKEIRQASPTWESG